MANNWLMWDRIRTWSRVNRLYSAERNFQDQSQLDRITSSSEYADWSQQAAILDQSQIYINRLQRYRDLEQMDQCGEISLALDLFADEGCITGDTIVPLLDGTYPTIDELAQLDPNIEFWVNSYDDETNKYVPALAKNARVTGHDRQVIAVTLDDGETIKCTADHLFKLIDGSDCQAGDLQPGSRLMPLDYWCECIVASIQPAGVAQKVYDIEVPEYHCFAAGTNKSWVIIHNSMVDSERKHTLIIRAKSRRIKRELEELFFGTLLWDANCRPSIRYLCKFGDCPYEVVPTKNRDGVAALRHMSVYNFTRVETKNGDLVGFFFQDEMVQEPIFMHPWQVAHIRLQSLETAYNPYGKSVLDGGRKAFKQLRLMEDAALIYRIVRAPDKLKFKIPTGTITPKEIPEYMEMIARKLKRKRFYNPSTGTFDEGYSPLIQEDSFFMPVRQDGTGPDVEVLAGASNLNDIADIEYFKKKMIAPTKIPFSRVGIGEGAGETHDKSLSATDADFAKAVQWVQRAECTGLTKVAIIHLALRGYSIEDIKSFELSLTTSSAIEELYRMETWQTRTQVMSDLKEIGWFPKEWIITHFTDLTPDEIEELKEMEELAGQGGEDGGEESGLGGGGGGLGGALGGGGGDDLGGDLGAEVEDKDETGGLSDEEGVGKELGGAGGLGDEEPGGPAKGGLGESVIRERRILKELARRKRFGAMRTLLENWCRRLGKDVSERSRDITSQWSYLLESKEIDGLSRTLPETDSAIHDPKDDAGLLVEWSVSAADRDSAIAEVRNVIKVDDGEVVADDVDEIVSSDIPRSEHNGVLHS